MARTAPVFPGIRGGFSAAIVFLAILCACLAPTAGQEVRPPVAIIPQLDDPAPVRSVAFSPDGRLVLSGDYASL